MIHLDRVCREFPMGGEVVRALIDIDERIEAGEHVAVMGPSGSGKSTLLNIIGCLDRPSSGHYTLDGQDVGALSENALSELRQNEIGFVFQTFHLVPRLTAEENVAFPMVFAGIPLGERRKRAREVMESVGLGHRLHHRPNEMSGGERQRVAIARATIMRPRVLLADEPTGNLDSRSGQQVLELLEGLVSAGITLIVVTHNPGVASRCSRCLVLTDGRIVRRMQGAEFSAPSFIASDSENAP